MTTRTASHDVKSYLDAVRARLDDLPAEERDDLLADVEPSILEGAEESDAPVELRLGPPHAFADELRSAAGLPPRAEGPEAAPRAGLRDRLAAADAFFTSNPATRWLRELAPLWWAFRGVVAVGLIELLLGESLLGGSSLPAHALALALAVVVAVTASVAVGLRRPRRNTAVVVVNLVLALAAVAVSWNAIGAASAVLDDGGESAAPPAFAPGLTYDDVPVENIYAFDREGRLLYDVRLFMQDGRPLAIGGPDGDPNRRTVRSRDGDLAFNAFPIRYFEPGTRRVADPAAGAPPRPGPVATKPLGRR
jgi:hypothetical protein